MDLLFIVSLVAAAIVSVTQMWKSEATKKYRVPLGILSLLALGIVIFKTKKDSEEKVMIQEKADKAEVLMRKKADIAEDLLVQTKKKIDSQTTIINDGFKNLHDQITKSGAGDSGTLAVFQYLQTQANQISVAYNNYYNKVYSITPQTVVVPGKPTEDSTNPNEFKIPVNHQNTLPFDTKNNFTISKYFEKEKVLFLKINGHDVRFGLGAEYKIVDDQGKKITMIYKGIEGENHIFLLQR